MPNGDEGFGTLETALVASPFAGAAPSPFVRGPQTAEEISAFGRQLGLASVPPRLAQFQEGILALQRLAGGSPQALTEQLAPQIEQLRGALQQMFRQAAQRFGPFGGGQLQQAQAQAAAATGGQLTRMFAGLPEQARNALLALIQGFQITPQPPTPVTQVTATPFSPQGFVSALQAGQQLGQLGQRIFAPSPIPTPSPLTTFTPPPTGDITQAGFALAGL